MDLLNQTFYNLYKTLMLAVRYVPYRAPSKKKLLPADEGRTNYPFVFVAGFWGWGEYNRIYPTLPYWGMAWENMTATFNKLGYHCIAADPSPQGSAWDRACELYAQLTGTRVDYGRAHSEESGHPRYGKDYTGKALIPSWNETDKINIICHSFGGPTCALLASLLKNGSEKERQVTDDGSLSPLFKGGLEQRLYSVTSIAAAFNGTSLVMSRQAIASTMEYLRKEIPMRHINPVMWLLEAIAATFEKVTTGDVPDPDTGLYDMVPANAVEMNKNIHIADNVYYFSVPCCCTGYNAKRNADFPDFGIADPFFVLTSLILGRTDVTAKNGLILGKEWQPNDGLVNTYSQLCPHKEEYTLLHRSPSELLPREEIRTGHYYLYDTYPGSHNDPCGGIFHHDTNAAAFVNHLMYTVNSL